MLALGNKDGIQAAENSFRWLLFSAESLLGHSLKDEEENKIFPDQAPAGGISVPRPQAFMAGSKAGAVKGVERPQASPLTASRRSRQECGRKGRKAGQTSALGSRSFMLTNNGKNELHENNE
jgi:hypothetical protein